MTFWDYQFLEQCCAEADRSLGSVHVHPGWPSFQPLGEGRFASRREVMVTPEPGIAGPPGDHRQSAIESAIADADPTDLIILDRVLNYIPDPDRILRLSVGSRRNGGCVALTGMSAPGEDFAYDPAVDLGLIPWGGLERWHRDLGCRKLDLASGALSDSWPVHIVIGAVYDGATRRTAPSSRCLG